MSQVVLDIEKVSKLYHLGTIGYGSLKAEVQSWWAKIHGREDPNTSLDPAHAAHADFWALKDVSFQLRQGERLGIVGRNGAGKSTLLKILSRITSPTAGELRIRGRIVSLLEVGTGFVGELTGRDNVFLNGGILGMKRREIQRRFDEIVDFAGIEQFIDTPVKRYSSGMFVRLGFAVAAHLNADIMIIDEVLSVGDADFQQKSLNKMRQISLEGGKTIIFVSHNVALVDSLCTSILHLRKGAVHAYSSDVKSALGLYEKANE